MADGPVALQFLTKRRFVVYVRHEPHAREQPDVLAVITCDASAFLPAMLEGVQTEIGQSRRFLMTVDTQKTTLVANHSVSSLPAQNALLSPPPCGGTVFPLTAPGPALQARRPTSARRYKGRVI